MMQITCGIISWILGGLLLSSGMTAASLSIGWVMVGAGASLLLPHVWKLETRATPQRIRYLLRAPYLSLAGLFGAFSIISIWNMVQSMTAGFLGESILLGASAILLFAAVDEIISPLVNHVRELELDGRPQPLLFNVFEVAQVSGGRLTPSELAASHDVDYRDAKATLLRLVDEGACERIVTRNGAIVFCFPELETDKVDLLES